jgi:UDP-N-acetylmuramoyl-tripeptide--D-alanyl-D-alanine ligase
VRKSEKSFTTELGLPLTILGCAYGKGSVTKWLQNLWTGLLLIVWRQNYPDWLILEIDADKPGDVDSIKDWLAVDILVVTAIGNVPSHVEAFSSNLEKFLDEKRKLLDLISRDGRIVYNADDETAGQLVKSSQAQKISCGISVGVDFSGTDFEILNSNTGGFIKPTGMKFDVSSGSEKISIAVMDTVGIHNEYAVLLSLAVANLLSVPMSEAIKMIEKSPALPGRMKILAGLKDTTIIDDSYNSSPVAMRQAVETLAKLPASVRKIVIVGDMLELGKYSSEAHREVGNLLAPVASVVVCVGLRARRVSEAMLSLSYDENNISCFDDVKEVGDFLQNLIQPGDVILVKGSQSMRLEKIVEQIMRHPEDKTKLLVRQESEWLERG